ncbi:MAG: BatD family protein [candidate division KSB1 bacterium]|nr:BatD family protein [candidate division KSB1 bacterium]
MKTINYFCLVVLLFYAGSMNAQDLNVQASVDRTRLSVNDRLTLTVELSGSDARQAGRPDLPDMQGFLQFLGSGGTSQNISIVNGKMSASKAFTFYYRASKAGSFTIPAIQVTHKGQTVSSDPIPLTIMQSGAQPSRTPSDQTEGLDDHLMVRALVDKKQVYQHEPVHVTYRIYARVNVTSYGISKLPELTGFWSEDFDMPSRPQTRQEVINGNRYTVADIKRTALFPTSQGKKTIGPLVLDCEIRMQRGSGRDVFDSFFDDPFGRTVRKSISSEPVDITVKPLPKNGRPPGFSGAVGQYQLDAGIDKRQVETDEAITLKVTLSGTGNIKMLPVPEPDFPSDFELYDPKVTQTVNRSGDRITGNKTVEYVLIPRFPGEQRIPPVRFSYFNPKTKSYETLSSPEFIISVSKSDDTYSAPAAGLSREEVKLLGQDIHFIKLESGSFQRLGSHFYNSLVFILLAFIPLAGIAGTAVYKKQRDKLSQNYAYARRKKANAMAMKRLSRAKAVMNVDTQKQFYSEISDALYGFAADKLNKEKAGLLSSEIEKEFKIRTVPQDFRNEFFDLLKTCDFMRFAPAGGTEEDMEQFYQRAKEMIIKLEKEF